MIVCQEKGLIAGSFREEKRAFHLSGGKDIPHKPKQAQPRGKNRGRRDDASKLFRFLFIQSESYGFLVPSFRLWKGHTSLLDLTLYPRYLLINLIGCSALSSFFPLTKALIIRFLFLLWWCCYNWSHQNDCINNSIHSFKKGW